MSQQGQEPSNQNWPEQRRSNSPPTRASPFCQKAAESSVPNHATSREFPLADLDAVLPEQIDVLARRVLHTTDGVMHQPCPVVIRTRSERRFGFGAES